ncbi:SpoIIE family protein phosphatase [Dactylosporangium sp. NPDC006015]|uniref:SpoIIE family protein phosphatase n=1 Tax=Dactylosporangium sp. NPDC006015 TaxID=3154576 RepID=UPI0033BBC4DC
MSIRGEEPNLSVADDDQDLSWLAGDALTVRRVFDQMPLLVTALEGDAAQLRVVAMTAQYRQFVGRQDVVGRMLREAFAEFAGQQILEFFERVAVTGVAETAREFRITFDRPDLGDQVEVFVDFTISPFYGPDGSLVGALGNVQDVTERVRERQAAQAQAAEAQARYEQARDVINALQRELLPAGVPVLPGLEVAASYLLADAETAAGGDWFDAVVLPDERVALIVGDVVGHGLAASATMGQLRVLLREQLLASGDLLTALTRVNTAAAWVPGAKAATVCVAVLDPATGTVTYCTAGHPAPLLLPAAGEARFLPISGAGPLGVGGTFTAAVLGTATLDTADTILLYTDGILERPGTTIARSSVELAQVAGDIAAGYGIRDDGLLPTQRICGQTLELLTRRTGRADDITLLAGRRTNPPKSLNLTFSVVGDDQLEVLRTELSDWLAGCGVDAHDDGVVRHAVVELVTNSLEHAYLDRADADATCELTATIGPDGHLHAQVTDRGTWRKPQPSPDRGLGLQLAEAMVDHLRIRHDQHGTTATIDLTLTRPAWLLTTDQLNAGHPARPPGQSEPLLILDQPWAPTPRIRVDGPIDAATTNHVERALREAGAVGTRNLTVDLTGVTHLASAGVAALHRLTAIHHTNDTTLQLYAPIAGPADMILTLVGLNHTTHDPHTTPGNDEAKAAPDHGPDDPVEQ